jgi:radical SAM superfamily enzyme YgiQ (UPF0313 family)
MRVLFTVPPTHPIIADYGAILTSHIHKKPVNRFLSASYPIPSWGLYWIKENCPTVEILDMPSWRDLERELKKGVDILGIGFYTYQSPDVIKLVEMARKYGVEEIWGGNYGTQTPGMDIYFDRVIGGNGEAETYRLLYNKELDTIKHPTVVQTWRLNGIIGRLFRLKSFNWANSGILWTIKGCYYNCNFCVSQSFINRTRHKIPLSEIERVLDKYVEKKIKTVSVMDLDFLMDKEYADSVIEMLHNRKLQWTCMTRVDHIQGNIKYLREMGCVIIFVGVESLNIANLEEQNKYKISRRESLLSLFDELKKHKMGYYLFYMLGFENDTFQSLKKEIDFLSSLQATFYQFQVVTPLPGSNMFEQYKHRIINWNWSDWNCNTLVWKHPHLTPRQMEEILIYAKKKTSLSHILSGLIRRGTLDDSFDGNHILRNILKFLFKRFSPTPKKQKILIRNSRS